MLRLVIVSALLAAAAAQISNGCKACIRQTEGGTEGECNWDVYSDSCGPYQIKIEYWCDSEYIDPADCTVANYDGQWRDCTMYLACSDTTVDNYMDRYGSWCSGESDPQTCEVYARIHNGGPNGCNSGSTDGYWDIVGSCCNSNGNC